MNMEKFAHVAVIIGCMTAIAVTLERRLGPPALESQSSSLVGNSLSIPNLDWRASPRHSVVAFSSSCNFCRASIPFYRRLGEQGKNPLIILTPANDNEAQRLLTAQGVKARAVVKLDLKAYSIRITPTLLVVDSQGKILRAAQGRLDAEKEEQFLSHN